MHGPINVKKRNADVTCSADLYFKCQSSPLVQTEQLLIN